MNGSWKPLIVFVFPIKEKMLACCWVTPSIPISNYRRRFHCRAEEDQQTQYTPIERQNKKKVLIVGSGWAGLGAAHHLSKQVIASAVGLIELLHAQWIYWSISAFDGLISRWVFLITWFQGLDVTVLEGGYEFGPKNKTFSPDDVGIRS